MKKHFYSIVTKAVLIPVVLLITLGETHVSFAQDTSMLSFQQLDLDADGKPDEAVIECACVTDTDRILVFDGAGDMLSSRDWQEGTDLVNDTWVFDIGSYGNANLIVQFQSNGDEQVARLYDDVDGDSVVRYHIAGSQIVIDESSFWSMEVTAPSGWFMETGQTNLNITAFLDKPVFIGLEFVNDEFAREYMPHDGQPDLKFVMVDENRDGVAEFFLSSVIADIPARFEIGRSRLWSNVGLKSSQRPDTAKFWPFLNLQMPTGAARDSLRFFDLLPSVLMDWQSSAIQGFVLPGYPVEEGYWINSQSSISDAQVNEVSYEAPHAWYDLAEDQDGVPELNIRLFEPLGEARYEIRYSWNQTNTDDLVWDYKLGLLGNHPIDDTINLQNFRLQMIPYEELPQWVIEHEWELTTFVAREGEARRSSEGIYAWTPWNGADPLSPENPGMESHRAALSYVRGESVFPPYDYFNEIWEGFRGEYNLARPLRPLLYFSSIDHRLHLKGAEYGLLNLGNGRYVTYNNRDGDDYFEEWVFSETGEVRRKLYTSKDYLLYSNEDKGEVLLKKSAIAPSTFETLPPHGHKEWLELGEKLEKYKQELAPDDFEGMIRQFDGLETHIQGASLKDFRSTQDGFRFILELQPGFRVSTSEAPNWNHLQPGSYVVTYNESMNILPITPPVLSESLITTTLDQLEQNAIRVVLRNDGLEDINEATLELWATSPDGITSVIATQTVQLLAGEPITPTLLWTPDASGTWILTPKIRQPNGYLSSGDPLSVTVAPSQTANIHNLLLVSTSPEMLPMFLTGLITFATLAALVLWQAWRRSVVSKDSNER